MLIADPSGAFIWEEKEKLVARDIFLKTFY